MRNVLIIAPHTDDAELGAGGAIARYVEEGRSVRVVALSDCRENVPAGLPDHALRGEMRKSMELLQTASHDIGHYRVRGFQEERQKILDFLISLREIAQPDLVICPAPSDRHQDHRVTADECLRAFRCSTWGFILPWNTLASDARGFVQLEDRHVNKKIEAVGCYHSQEHRRYAKAESIRAWAMTVGMRVGCDFAEEFEIIRAIN